MGVEESANQDLIGDDPMHLHAEARVGSLFADKYELRSVLGVGAMGAVFRAKHRFTGAEVALKLLHPQFAGSRGTVRRFLDEAKAAAAIGHPGVVQVQDAGQDPKTLEVYIAMELLLGENLASAIERKAIDLRALLRIAIDLLAVLQASHEAGVIHRDVKPANVFLTTQAEGHRQVKLLDFGVARFASAGGPAHTRAGAVLGTPWYMSPEQAQGLRVDARADVWSVGAVLFHALANRPPFAGETATAILASITRDRAPSISQFCPTLSHAVAAVVDRALEHDPKKRWPGAAAMSAALEAALETLPRDAVPIAPSHRGQATRLSWREHPLRARGVDVLVATLAAVAVVSLVGFVLHRRALNAALPPTSLARTGLVAPFPASAPTAPSRPPETFEATTVAAAQGAPAAELRRASGRPTPPRPLRTVGAGAVRSQQARATTDTLPPVEPARAPAPRAPAAAAPSNRIDPRGEW